MPKKFVVRAFRASDDSKTCLDFVENHQKRLKAHNALNVSTNTADWMHDPLVVVIVIECPAEKVLYGGARIHLADKAQPLPMETALEKMDPSIHEKIHKNSAGRIGELSALWNSTFSARSGIDSRLIVRTGLVLAKQLDINTFFFLCAPASLKHQKYMGGEVFTCVGDEGRFVYPRHDLISTVVCVRDAIALPDTPAEERERIFFLRENLGAIMNEANYNLHLPVQLQFDLAIPALATADRRPAPFLQNPTETPTETAIFQESRSDD